MPHRKVVSADELTPIQICIDRGLQALTAAHHHVRALGKDGHSDAARQGAQKIRAAMEAWGRLLNAVERRLAHGEPPEPWLPLKLGQEI